MATRRAWTTRKAHVPALALGQSHSPTTLIGCFPAQGRTISLSTPRGPRQTTHGPEQPRACDAIDGRTPTYAGHSNERSSRGWASSPTSDSSPRITAAAHSLHPHTTHSKSGLKLVHSKELHPTPALACTHTHTHARERREGSKQEDDPHSMQGTLA